MVKGQNSREVYSTTLSKWGLCIQNGSWCGFIFGKKIITVNLQVSCLLKTCLILWQENLFFLFCGNLRSNVAEMLGGQSSSFNYIFIKLKLYDFP